LEKYGSAYLYRKLKRFDRQAAQKIHPNDVRRIIRALEVFEATGKPISGLQRDREGLSKYYDVKIFCLNMDRSSLYKRIDSRVDKMFREGLLKEVKGLLRKKLSKTSRYAIGLGELAEYFEGKYDLAEAKRLMQRNTRHYAKRQLTWFRKDKRIEWVNIGVQDKPQQIAQRICSKL
jgi:tRNA dimethylallyltransferase